MKKKIILGCLLVAAVAAGILLNRMADIDIENSKMEVPKNRTVKTDDRAEKLQEALKVDNDGNIAVEDIDKSIEDQTFEPTKRAAYTDDGFYVYNVSTNLVSFVDKKTCTMVPLCSKPDCSHSYIDCDAFYYTFKSIFVYDDKLYVVAEDDSTSTLCLYRINKDGSERTLVKTLFAIEDDNTGYSFRFVLHKGCLYMVTDTSDGEIYTEDDIVLFCYPLDSKDKKEIIRHKGYNADILIISCDGDNMYLRVFNLSSKETDAEEVTKYYCYNTKDETMTELNVPKGYDVLYCSDGRFLANYSEAKPPEYNIEKYELHKINNKSGKDKIIYTNEDFLFCHSCVDSKYQYMIINKDGGRYLVVVSHDGKEVYQTEAKDYTMLVWSDKKDVLLKSDTTGNYALCNIKTGKIEEVSAFLD